MFTGFPKSQISPSRRPDGPGRPPSPAARGRRPGERTSEVAHVSGSHRGQVAGGPSSARVAPRGGAEVRGEGAAAAARPGGARAPDLDGHPAAAAGLRPVRRLDRRQLDDQQRERAVDRRRSDQREQPGGRLHAQRRQQPPEQRRPDRRHRPGQRLDRRRPDLGRLPTAGRPARRGAGPGQRRAVLRADHRPQRRLRPRRHVLRRGRRAQRRQQQRRDRPEQVQLRRRLPEPAHRGPGAPPVGPGRGLPPDRGRRQQPEHLHRPGRRGADPDGPLRRRRHRRHRRQRLRRLGHRRRQPDEHHQLQPQRRQAGRLLRRRGRVQRRADPQRRRQPEHLGRAEHGAPAGRQPGPPGRHALRGRRGGPRRAGDDRLGRLQQPQRRRRAARRHQGRQGPGGPRPGSHLRPGRQRPPHHHHQRRRCPRQRQSHPGRHDVRRPGGLPGRGQVPRHRPDHRPRRDAQHHPLGDHRAADPPDPAGRQRPGPDHPAQQPDRRRRHRHQQRRRHRRQPGRRDALRRLPGDHLRRQDVPLDHQQRRRRGLPRPLPARRLRRGDAGPAGRLQRRPDRRPTGRHLATGGHRLPRLHRRGDPAGVPAQLHRRPVPGRRRHAADRRRHRHGDHPAPRAQVTTGNGTFPNQGRRRSPRRASARRR